MADFSHAIDMNRKFASAYTDRGIACLQQGQYDRAIDDLSRAIKLGTRSTAAYLYRSEAYAAKGNNKKARADLQTIVRSTSDTALRESIETLLLGREPKRLPQPDKADTEAPKNYSNPVYGWKVSYPANWVVDSSDPDYVTVSSGENGALCGFHSGAVPFKTVDELTDSAQEFLEKYSRERNTETRSSPKQQVTLPNDVIAIQVTTDILSGGKSHQLYVLHDAVGYTIVCETYAGASWEKFEPYFARIRSSFALANPR